MRVFVLDASRSAACLAPALPMAGVARFGHYSLRFHPASDWVARQYALPMMSHEDRTTSESDRPT